MHFFAIQSEIKKRKMAKPNMEYHRDIERNKTIECCYPISLYTVSIGIFLQNHQNIDKITDSSDRICLLHHIQMLNPLENIQMLNCSITQTKLQVEM